MIEATSVEVRVSNPGKAFFPELGVTKLDLVNYYLALADPRGEPRRVQPSRARKP